MPRRKVKSGSLADISRGDKPCPSGAAVERIANNDARVSSFAIMGGGRGAGPVTAAPIHAAGDMNMPRAEVTPDKSPKPQLQDDVLSSSSSDESEDERTKLISDIDFLKLSPGINPHNMSNYELLRLRNIQRNEAKLASLGLMGMTSKKPAAKKPAPKKPTPSTAIRKAATSSPYVFKSSASHTWHTRHHELLSHVVHGVLSVPSSNKSLHNWIRRQKTQYQKYKYGEKSALNEEKARLLLAVAPEKFWLGICKSPGAVTKSVKTKASRDEESIGSQDSFSEDELPYSKPTPQKSKKTAVQRELKGLRSPQWMDGFDEDRNGKAKSVKSRVVQRKPDYFDDSNDEMHVTKQSAKQSAKKSSAKSQMFQRKRDYFDDNEDDFATKQHSADKISAKDLVQRKSDYFDDSHDGQYKPKSSAKRGTKRFAIRDRSDDESDYSDEESVHGRRTYNRSSRKRGGRRIVRDYSDDDISLEELRSRRGSSSKSAHSSSRKEARRQIQAKPKRAVVKSSLEMLNADDARPTKSPPPKKAITDQPATHRPSKRKGVVSEEPERPSKRLHKEHVPNKYSRNGYDSEESSSYSDDRSTSASYSSTSVSAASTNSSSIYGPNKPMNEVLITQQTNTLTARNQRNYELKARMAHRQRLMLEYKFIYAQNMERLQSLRRKEKVMQSLEAQMIKNGGTLFDRVESTEQVMLRCKANSADMIEGTLMSPAELERRGVNAGLLEASLHVREHVGMIDGPSLTIEGPSLRDETQTIEWL